MMLVLETALRMPLREAACNTGNKFSNVSCAKMLCDNRLISLYFLQPGIETRSVQHENAATGKV
jgi:hypothetical protein